MRKSLAFILSILTVFSLAACGAESTKPEETKTEPLQAESDTETAFSKPEEGADSNLLIAYFTYGENAELPDNVDASATASIQIFNGEVTGNTGVMARMIAEASGGELFSIRTVEPYPDNYNDTIDVGQAEAKLSERNTAKWKAAKRRII